MALHHALLSARPPDCGEGEARPVLAIDVPPGAAPYRGHVVLGQLQAVAGVVDTV